MAVAISAVSVISSVGRDFATACAAIRAGMARPQPIVGFEVVDDETQEASPLIGHPLAGFAEGFNMIGFWLRVGTACVRDLLGKLPQPLTLAECGRTAIICITPYLNDDRFESEGDDSTALVREIYVLPLCRQLQLSIPGKHQYCLGQDRIGLFRGLQAAEKLMATNEIDRVILLAVDSMLDSMTLEWLVNNNRLRSPGNPVGLTPGEGGVALLVTKYGIGKSEGPLVLAIVDGIATDQDSSILAEAVPLRGRVLANTVRAVLKSARVEWPFDGDIIIDLNGEEWRAKELGHAQVLLNDVLASHYRMLMPCMSTGDIGAGTTALGLAVAIWYFMRRCARSTQSLLIGSSHSGAVGAMCLRNP